MTAELDVPKNKAIAGLIVATCITIVTVIFGVNEYYDKALRGELERKVSEENNTMLKTLRADEQKKLSSYQWVDKTKNVVRVPLDRARELTLAAYDAPAAPVVAPAPPKVDEKH